MPLLDQENCIARLRLIAEKLSGYRDGDVPGILAQVLSVDPNTMEFHRALIALEDLGTRARQQVEELTGDSSYNQYIEVIDRIVDTFKQLNMRENWLRYMSAFNVEALTLLGVCERAFQSLMITKYQIAGTPPDEPVLQEALSDIREVSDSIIQANIEPEAKQLLHEILREAENAIQMYQISGLAGLRHAIERIFGAFVVNHDLLKQPRNQGVVRRVWGVFVTLINVAQRGYFIDQLTGGQAGDLLKELSESSFFQKMLNP
jgi:hypothetical protein